MKLVSEFDRRRALQLYPQLAQAVAPMPLGLERRHRFESDVAYRNYFWDDHRRDFTLREPINPDSVVSLRGLGHCLSPLRSDGDLMHFDSTVPARCGDIVLFQHHRSPTALHFMGKMLVEFGGEYWLAWNEGMFPLGDTRILGVEVRAPLHRARLSVELDDALVG